MSASTAERFFLCVTCGTLQPAHRFAEGDCTCKHCNDEGRTGVKWQKADDGNGFISRDD